MKINSFLLKKDQKRPHQEPFLFYLRKISKNQKNKIELNDVIEFINKISQSKDLSSWFLPEWIFENKKNGKKEPIKHETLKKVPQPELNLFLWCILSNRMETAMLFWKLGKVDKM